MTARHRTIEHVVCRRCGGSSGPVAAFCSSCGAYLTWWGERVVEDVVDDVPDSADPVVPDTIEGLPAPVHPHHIHSPHLSAMILRMAEHLGVAEHLHHRQEHAQRPREQAPESYAEFVAEPEPIEAVAWEPAPMTPALEQHRVHDISFLIGRPDEHGRRCASCETGNDLSRAFCRHCGDALVTRPAEAPHTSWWQRQRAARRERIVRRMRLSDDAFAIEPAEHRLLHLPRWKLPAPGKAAGPKPAAPAGAGAAAPGPGAPAAVGPAAVPPVVASRHLPAARTRPPDFNALRAGLGGRRLAARLFPKLGLAITLGTAVGSLTIWRDDVGAVVRTALVKAQLLADVEERTLTVQSLSATASVPGRVPQHLADGTLQTYWAVDATAVASTTVTISFAQAEKVTSIGVSSGVQNGDSTFKGQPRPHHLEIGFDDGTTATIALSDSATFQRHDVPDHVTTSLTIRVIDTYPAVNGSGTWVAISEIVPLQRRF